MADLSWTSESGKKRYIGAGRGATMWELQINRLYIRFLQRRFWCRKNWPFLRVTWCTKELNMPERKTV